MRILVFGAGRFYMNRRSILLAYGDNVIAFLDNRADTIRTIEGKEVMFPQNVANVCYDLILLMGKDWRGMRDQLLSLGLERTRIYTWERYVCDKERGRFKVHMPRKLPGGLSSKRILVISTSLAYNGGSLAAVYAVLALQSKGYDVTLAAQEAEARFQKEIMVLGIRLVVAGGLPFLGREELDWMRLYDIVIVNVFQMLGTACKVSCIRPTLWWIHEPSLRFGTWYSDSIDKFPEDAERIMGCNAAIFAVSNIAKRNFEQYYPNRIDGIMPYGIPDEQTGMQSGNRAEKFTFAVIGSVDERKGQDVFIQAIGLLPESLRRMSKFLLIGSCSEDSYGCSVRHKADLFSQVSFLGQLSRKEILKMFGCVDAVVSSSLEDPLPIVITEGWMHSKVCILTDATGQASMTEDGVNGLVCKAGDARSMADKIVWVLRNQDKLSGIRRRGRATYEKYFTMESFGERLEQALIEAERKFYEKRD